MTILGFDLGAALTPDVSLFETVARGVLMYAAIFVMLRVVLRGRTGAMTTSDLLVLVLIADAAQNAMAGEYTSVGDGLILVATIVGWAWFLDWVGYRFPSLERFVYPKPLLLIDDGHVLPQNLRRELLTHEELMSQLRAQGVEDVSEVRRAFLEGSGALSVVKKEGNDTSKAQPKTPGATG